MKKLLIILTVVTVLLITQTASATTIGTYREKTRLRAAPSLSAAVKTTYPAGAQVTIQKEENGWYLVSHKSGLQGWSKKEYLLATEEIALDKTLDREAAEGVVGEYTVNGRVRSGHSLSFATVTTVPKGTRVTIHQTKNGWHEIEYKGQRGWCSATVLRVVAASEIAIPVVPVAAEAPITVPKIAPAPAVPRENGVIKKSPVQAGVLPEGVDTVTLNTYWLEKINALRADQNLQALVLDQRFVDSATEYAGTIGEIGKMTHSRPNGKTMHQWIDGKKLGFTKRGSDGGWKVNYFTENLSSGQSDGTTESVQNVLDRGLEFFLNEGAGGAHYKTIYHEDWNSVGLGFFLKPREDGRFDVMVVYHYGSLQM